MDDNFVLSAAEKAGLISTEGGEAHICWNEDVDLTPYLIAFARLVAEAERERIIAAAAAKGWGMRDDSSFEDAIRDVAEGQ